jgi:thiol-disulfide isomerase/thioredoxin
MNLPKIDRKYWVCMGLAVLLLLFLYYKNYTKPSYNKKNYNNLKISLISFHTKWCGYSQKLMDTGKWDAVKKHFNNTDVEVFDVDCDAQPTIAEKHKIDAYPTIKLIISTPKETFDYIYNDQAEPEKIISFVDAHLNKYK